jgi:hypothetical protein
MAELPKMPIEDPSRHLREALSQEQLLPSPCHWRPTLCGSPLAFSHLPWERSATARAICSPNNGCLCLLPASGLADGSSPMGSGGRLAGSALARPPLGGSLSFLLMEWAKRQVLGPPVPEHRQRNNIYIYILEERKHHQINHTSGLFVGSTKGMFFDSLIESCNEVTPKYNTTVIKIIYRSHDQIQHDTRYNKGG